MIAWGMAVGSEEKLARYAAPGLARVREEGDPLLEVRGATYIFEAYNELLDRAAATAGLEALVLLHEDLEICDGMLPDKLRVAFEDPAVAVAGVVGALGVSGIDWWFCEHSIGRVEWQAIDPVRAFGTPYVTEGGPIGNGGAGIVDAVDGLLLALSPWAVRNLRFDESLGPGFHGYDVDICFQARSAGRKVACLASKCKHHNDNVFPYRDAWMQVHERFRRKWESVGVLSEPPWVDWDETERAAAYGELRS
jgi:hypothetical protein